MPTYQIISKAGQDMGTFEGATPAEALLTMHRDAGYGEDVVMLVEPGGYRLDFAGDDVDRADYPEGRRPEGAADYRTMLGDVDAWTIREVSICAYCTATVPADEGVPALRDDAAWTALGADHAEGCEWIATRAHRRDEPACAALDEAPDAH